MILAACILWLGLQMSAPVWFYVLLGIFALFKVFVYGQAFGKALNSKKESDE